MKVGEIKSQFYIYLLVIAVMCLFYARTTLAKNNVLCRSYTITSSDVSSYPHFIEKNKYYAIGAVLLISGSLLIDKDVRRYALDHQNHTTTHIANAIKPFGNGWVMFPSVFLLSLFGYATDNTKLMDASLTSLESGVFAGLITLSLKSIIGRKRPYATSSNLTFEPFNIKNRYASFPSGDATVAWSMITPYAVYYHQPLLYIIPTLVDLERIYKNDHWTSDVIAGSAIGFSVGYLFSENHLKLSKTMSLQTDGRDVVLDIRF